MTAFTGTRKNAIFNGHDVDEGPPGPGKAYRNVFPPAGSAAAARGGSPR